MSQKKFTKDQIAHKIGLQAYILAAWEKQFNIVPLSKNGETLYTRQHLATFRSIKELLYEKGFSMDAAKKYLQDNTAHLEGKTLLAASPLLFETKKEAARQPFALHPTVEASKASPKLAFEPLAQRPAQRTIDQDVAAKLLHIKSQLTKISNTL